MSKTPSSTDRTAEVIAKGMTAYISTADKASRDYGQPYRVKSVRRNASTYNNLPLVLLEGYGMGMVSTNRLVLEQHLTAEQKKSFAAAQKKREALATERLGEANRAAAFERTLREENAALLNAAPEQLEPVAFTFEAESSTGKAGANIRHYRVAGRGLDAKIVPSINWVGVELTTTYLGSMMDNRREWGVTLPGYTRNLQQARITQEALTLVLAQIPFLPAPK